MFREIRMIRVPTLFLPTHPCRAEQSIDPPGIEPMPELAAASSSLRMHPDDLIEAPITKSVIGAFFEVYNTLRYGFLEQHYSRALHLELESRGHQVGREVFARVIYKGNVIGLQKIDMVVDEKIVIEIKASEQLHPAGMRQLVSYMRATDLPVGLLLHFGPEAKYYRRVQTSRADHRSNT